MMTEKVTSAHIRAALRDRFPATSHALMFEVGNSTGHSVSRHADAIAMCLWPSRGMEVNGVEIKVSRGDWQREIKDHAKADAIQRYCDRWWIAAPKGLIKPSELPTTWGLLEFDGGNLRQKVAAQKLEAQPLTRGFMAAMLRRASEADAAEVEMLASKRLEATIDRERKNLAARNKLDLQQFEEMKAKLLNIKEATGIDIGSWMPSDRIVAAIEFALRMQISGPYDTLKKIADDAERLGKDVNEFMSRSAAKPHVPPKEICPNCDSALPEGCGGVFRNDGESCWLNKPHNAKRNRPHHELVRMADLVDVRLNRLLDDHSIEEQCNGREK